MTEIGTGIMVECIMSSNSSEIGLKFFVNKVVKSNARCNGRLCTDNSPLLVLSNYKRSWHTSGGWCACCFRPVGGDKEIEKQKFEELKPLMVPEHLVRLARYD